MLCRPGERTLLYLKHDPADRAWRERAELVAVHECGHAAVAVGLGQKFMRMTLRVSADLKEMRGEVTFAGGAITAMYSGEGGPEPPAQARIASGIAAMAIHLGGILAVESVLGKAEPLNNNDREHYEEGLAFVESSGGDRAGAIACAEDLARQILARWRGPIWQLAKRLLKKGTLRYEECRGVLTLGGAPQCVLRIETPTLPGAGPQ